VDVCPVMQVDQMDDMMARGTGRSRSLVATGVTFIAAGMCLNEWVLAALFSSDGVIADPHRHIIWIVDVCLVCTGILLMYGKLATKENVLTLTGIYLIATSLLIRPAYLPAIVHVDMNIMNRTIVKILDFYFFCTGTLAILYRRRIRRFIESRGIRAFGIANVTWIGVFLAALGLFDFSVAYIRVESSAIFSEIFRAKDTTLMKDDLLGWKLKPDSRAKFGGAEGQEVEYVIDDYGFRMIENIKNPRFSIYFFGDSFTFGHGVSNKDTFPNIIKDRYLRHDINVYNAGVGAYGIVQMFQRFLNTESRIKPGDLIVFTPLSDDIQRNIRDFYFPYYHYLSGKIPFDSYPFFDKGVIRYHTMEKNFSNTLKVLAFGAPVTGSLWHSLYKKHIPDTTQEAIEMLEIIKKRTERKGAKFVLFFLPETGECLWGDYVVDISAFDYFDIRRFFPSDEEELDELRFSKDDGHWKVRGHEIAARAIVETLRNHDILSVEDLSPRYRSSLTQ
jgi:hypothetical protein